MKIKYLKCDWGMENYGNPKERLKMYKNAGYDGVECANIGLDAREFANYIDELGLEYVAMIFCDTEQAFEEQLTEVINRRPILINCHPGRDFWDFDRGCDFFAKIFKIASSVDVEVLYETHRTRLLYAPWTTKKYLEEFPDMNLTGDFSHFTTVSEGNMCGDGYKELMDFIIPRTFHLHARVGYQNGPQVPDPRIGMGLQWTERFEEWWDRVIQSCSDQGRKFITINPEFGPPEYQPFHPSSGKPLADIWDICLWMTNRFKERWDQNASRLI